MEKSNKTIWATKTVVISKHFYTRKYNFIKYYFVIILYKIISMKKLMYYDVSSTNTITNICYFFNNIYTTFLFL